MLALPQFVNVDRPEAELMLVETSRQTDVVPT